MRIIVSCGDPNGIGIEILLKALHAGAVPECEVVLCVHVPTLCSYLASVGIEGQVEDNLLCIGDRAIVLLPCLTDALPLVWGKPTSQSGALAFESLQMAAQLTLDGKFDALVTLPVSKEALAMAGFKFPGQTEYLGALASVEPLMILAWENLRVALVTTHLPLNRVVEAITADRLARALEVFHRALVQDFGISHPRIAVLGLNPHAGEHGLLGREEDTLIAPTIERLRGAGLDVEGPFAADGFFARAHWRHYDGVVAQYHDQGLIPLKMLAAGGGVNITAGLPFVRTSPDHGTAYDIAGKGVAQWESTAAALHMAQYLALRRRQNSFTIPTLQ